jgi:hypothetical protein
VSVLLDLLPFSLLVSSYCLNTFYSSFLRTMFVRQMSENVFILFSHWIDISSMIF